MVENPRRLNDKQATVLRWIKDGCPDGVYPNGYEHRIVARSLERYGLVVISGRGPTWTARLTDIGRAWESPVTTSADSVASEADLLIERVIASGGRILLPKDPDIEKAHETIVRASLSSPTRPKGKHLVMIPTGAWGRGPKAIEFTEYFDDYVEPCPVPIPERVQKYHPAVKMFLDDRDWQYVTAEHVPRAARILQALADEAARRGFSALTPKGGAEGLRKHEASDIQRSKLAIRTPSGTYGVLVREISRSGAKKLERRAWNQKKTQPSWIENRGYEFISSGRLELVVHGPGTRHDGDRYRDSKSIRLEDKLPEVFRSFDVYKLRKDWQEQQRRREEAERRNQWDAAVARARDRYMEQARWELFKSRSREWQDIQQHRAFLEAVQASVSAQKDAEREALLSRLDEIRAELDLRDPELHPEMLLSEVPEPKPDGLKPFLDGWSPNSPVRLDWWAGLPEQS